MRKKHWSVLKYWRCGAGTFRMLLISLPNVLKHAYANHKNLFLKASNKILMRCLSDYVRIHSADNLTVGVRINGVIL